MKSKSLSFNKLALISAIGGGLEMYDFVIYIYLIPFISQIFFETNSAFLSSMAAFAVFGLGYLVRPLGGMVMGHLGDRYGRKKLFIFSILLMSLPILLTGLLPTPASIGISSTIAFILLRAIQGLAVGGEIPGAMAFINEHAPAHKRGFASGLIFCGLNLGLTAAALIAALMANIFSSTQMIEYGWRIPFILGAVIGLIAVYLRRQADESPLFLKLKQEGAIAKMPLIDLIRKPEMLIRGAAMTAMGAVLIVIGFTYMGSYLLKVLDQPKDSLWLIVAAVFISACLQPWLGALSDRMGRIKLLKICTVLMLVLSYPAYFLMTEGYIITGLTILTFFAAMIIGIYPALLTELFSTRSRYSGYAIAYNIGFATFGGLSPMVATLLIHETGDLRAPAYCLMAGALLGLFSLIGLKERSTTDLH